MESDKNESRKKAKHRHKHWDHLFLTIVYLLYKFLNRQEGIATLIECINTWLTLGIDSWDQVQALSTGIG